MFAFNQKPDNSGQIFWKKLFTFIICIYEQVFPGLVHITFWVLFFFGLWLFGVPQNLGFVAEIGFQILFYAGFIYIIWKSYNAASVPSDVEVRRRLEEASGLKYRPFDLINDNLANPKDPLTRRMWSAQIKQYKKVMDDLKLPGVKPLMAYKDPYAVRAGVFLFFILACFYAGHDGLSRITDGLWPFGKSAAVSSTAQTAIWITPPEYTKINPSYLSSDKADDQKQTIDIPEGSKIKVRVLSRWLQPSLKNGNKTIPIPQIGKNVYLYEGTISEGQILSVKHGLFGEHSWSYTFVKDTPPAISLIGEPETTASNALSFPLKVEDDYGVIELGMNMDLSSMIEDRPLGNPVRINRAVFTGAGESEIEQIFNLTSHTWAGLPVEFVFTVKDHTGQTGRSKVIETVLPEREFKHPVAVRLIELRKKLAWTPDSSRKEISRELETLLSFPDEFENDIVVFLAVRSAASRLYYDPRMKSYYEVLRLLWDTALRIEDGNLSLAMRALEEKIDEMKRSLNNENLQPEEFNQKLAELEQSLGEYLKSLRNELRKQNNDKDNPPMISPQMLEETLNEDVMEQFMQTLKNRMDSGEKEEAHELLSDLQRLMETLTPQLTGPMPQDMQQMMTGMNELQELIKKQKTLKEQTENLTERMQAQDGEKSNNQRSGTGSFGQQLSPDSERTREWEMGEMPPPPQRPGSQNQSEDSSPDNRPDNSESKEGDQESQGNSADLAEKSAEQKSLRYILGQLMKETGEALNDIPPSMGKAERSMKNSEDKLGQGQGEPSIENQEDAIRHLEDAMSELAQQLQQRMEEMTGMQMGQGQTDPLGRPLRQGREGQNGLFGRPVKIPDQAGEKYIREILRILRERSGDLDRPDYERDYIQRLLDKF